VLLRRRAGLFRSPEGLPDFERLRSRLRARAGGAVRAARVTLLVSRRGDGGQLRYAGGVRFGLSPSERARLRSVLERLELRRPARSRVRRLQPVVAVDVDYHGRPGGPLRDVVLRNVAVADELPASPT
jgi:hypothetical protein